ncbi:hypothetical protein WJX84_003841 [Apatococcus fuscideae]|uniref:Uncharacterized protein n=1 Tax=Apatococcus fuscideae TaxID=2026836 RepID=A0AAW1SUQ7_9CHLO
MLDFSVASNITVQELSLLQSSKLFPECLCQAAQTLDVLYTEFFGESQTHLLRRQPANVLPIFVSQELSQQTDLSPERRKQAAALSAQAATVAGAVAYYAGDTLALPWSGDCLALDMNDLTLPAVAKDLWMHQLGEGKFGIETTHEPSFPLQGMLWWYKHRPFFEMTVECRSKRIKLPMYVDMRGQAACLNAMSWKELAPDVDVSSWNARGSLLGKIHGVEAQIHFGQEATHGVNMVIHYLPYVPAALDY